MVDFRVSVVLPAGGCGSRMGMDIPKQYFRILGRPLISYTIEAFECISWIENIVIAGPVIEHQQKILEDILLVFDHKKVITTNGGSTRHRSIFNGVQCLAASDKKPDVVVIHDAVRPFIQEALLKDIVLAAHKHGACGVVRPLISTVLAKREDGFLDHSLDRSKYIGSEMPQAFQYDVILNAYQKCTEDDFNYGTECLQLALKHSQTRAFLIDGPDYLWKVTYRKDLFAAEGMIKARLRQYARFSGSSGNMELENVIGNMLNERGIQILKDVIKLSKTNILVDFTLLNQDESKISNCEIIINEITLKLKHIEKNGILVIVLSGCENVLSGCENVLSGCENVLVVLKTAIRHIAREGKEKRITCCAVWCGNFATSLTVQEKTTRDKVNDIAKMIVSVALETTLNFTGQLFTVLDTK